MFSLKGLMTRFLLVVIKLIPIGDLCIFGIQYNYGRTFIFLGIDIVKYCLILLAVELTVKLFFLSLSLNSLHFLLGATVTQNSLSRAEV